MVSFIIKWIGSFHCRPKAEIQLERYFFFLFLCFLLLPQNSKFEQREMFQKNEKIVEIVEINTVKQNPIFDTEMFSLFFEGQKSTDIDNCQIVENNSSIAYLS